MKSDGTSATCTAAIFLALGVLLLAFALLIPVACNGGERGDGNGSPSDRTGPTERPGDPVGADDDIESSGASPGSDSESDDVPARQYSRDGTYDQVHSGVRFTIYYEPYGPFFIGSAENTTDEHVWDVQVRIRLSSGSELGPTPPRNIGPGGSSQVFLEDTSSDPWTTWTVNGEVHGTIFPADSGIGIEQPTPGETTSPPQGASGDYGEPPRQYKWHETLDEVRHGVRLVLAYPETGVRTFWGRAENTTDKTLTNLRVVVRTSSGDTLITTPLRDLAPGEIMRVELGYDLINVSLDAFGTWTAYTEVDVDPAVAGTQGQGSRDPGPKAERPPIQDFVEVLDIKLDYNNFTGAEVLEACRYIVDQERNGNNSEFPPKAVERVRQIAVQALYPEESTFAYSQIVPLPDRDDKEAGNEWREGYTAWLTPQVDELMGLFCSDVFARHEHGLNVIGQLPRPADVTGAPPPEPLTQEDVAKLYRSLPPNDRSDPDTISYYCGLFGKHNWDRGAITAALKELEGSDYFRAPIYWWYELAGFVVKTPEWERWMLQEYDLPQDRRRWSRCDEWVTYWNASMPLEMQLIQMFCHGYEP